MIHRPTPAETRPDSPPAPRLAALFGLATLLGLGVALLALFALGWLADEMLEGDTLAFDIGIRAAVHTLASPRLTQLFILTSNLGGPMVLAPLSAALAATFAWRRWWRGAILLVVAVSGAGVLDAALKSAFKRPRPTPFFEYALPSSYSFPSGHALLAFCFFTATAALLAPRLPSPALRWLVWVVATLAIAAVGFSRVYLGVHYPSDVVAGYTAGLLWSSVIVAGDRMAHARARRRGGA